MLWSWNMLAVLALILMAIRLSSGMGIRIILNNDVTGVGRHILTITTLLRIHSHICLSLFLCLTSMCGLAFLLRSTGQRSPHCDLVLNGTLLALALQALALPRAVFGVETNHHIPDFVQTSCSQLEFYMSTLKAAAFAALMVAALAIIWSRRSSGTHQFESEEPITFGGVLGGAVGALFVLHVLSVYPKAARETYEIATSVCEDQEGIGRE